MIRSRRLQRSLLSLFLLFLWSCKSEGIEELRRTAETGDAAAQFQLALAYHHGSGVTQNFAEAAEWYRKAAEQGHAEAQNNLGTLFQFGQGVLEDYSKAIKWYQRAANKKLSAAQSNLGYMYDQGLGVPEDKVAAADLYRDAAKQKDAHGMLNLSMMYLHGEGVEKDIVEAYMWLDLARSYNQAAPNVKLKQRIGAALDEVKRSMTPEQISEAEKLAREWDSKNRSS